MSRSKWSRAVCCAAAVLAGASAAHAQFTDTFDSYTPGPLCPQGGWEEWAGSVDVCGEVSTEFAFSGSNSLKLIGAVGGSSGLGDDTIHRVDNFAGGVWEFSVMTYVPSSAEGVSYILLLNTYDDPPGSPIDTFRWSLQVRLDADNDLVISDSGGSTTSLIHDEWVEFRAVIDLDNDSVDYFYGGVEFESDRSWVNGVSTGGQPRIQCIDLYAGEPGSGTTGVYYDDVTLVPQGGVGCPCDWNSGGTVDSQDFFDFVTSFFAGDADFNEDKTTNSQDFFDFLTCFFSPPSGC